MCGIAGIFHRKQGRPDTRALDAMTDRLVHRGPDGRGTYQHEGVGFGHRRLSIIGISDGAQPMKNEDGTVWVTYNGEIYNYLELKAELQALGHTFASGSDTEVIVHGYEAWGPSVADRLRGIFAFAVHDQSANRVLCVRDRLGVKPLYYHLTPSLLLFASEPKALLVHPDMPRRPDLDGLNLYLRYGYVPAPHSAFESMRQLEPGCRMIVDRDAYRIERYWQPGPLGVGTASQVDATLDEMIDTSVGIELMSEVPLGAFLSGGIDSSIVAASMARSPALDARPRTFCIGFPEPDYDESGHSRAVAEHLQLDHTVDTISVGDLDILDTLVETYDEPFADSSAIPTFALCRMAKKHVTVALSGDGGDEVFAGYRRYNKLADYPRTSNFSRALARLGADLYPKMIRGQRKLRMHASTLGQQYDLDLSFFGAHMLPTLVEPDLLREPSWSLATIFERAPGDDPVLKAQWCDLVSYLPHDILTKVDRASMAHALEVRVPLLDHELLEWAFTLPTSQTFGGGEGKVALKNHLARRVPRKLFERPKMGFGVPLEYWLEGEGGLANIAKKLKGARGTFSSPIRDDAIENLAKRTGGWDFSQGIWSLLFLESWWQKHFD